MGGLMKFKVHHPAENYIYIDFGNVIDEEVNRHVTGMAEAISHNAVIEVIPSYSGIMIEYDFTKTGAGEIVKFLKKLKYKTADIRNELHFVPVVYGGPEGPDLDYVAKANGLTPGDVIKIHSSVDYRVHMLGFMPGFCYLGGMDPAIECPRKKKPRLKIEKGSVGIAGGQTGIYPSESPGGWQIIGRTGFEFYKPGTSEPFPVKAGDLIRFVPVDGADDGNH